MSNQRRSIWEVRFHALCERIDQKRTMLKHKAGRMALDNQLSTEDRENLKNRIDVLDQIAEDAESIKTQKSRYIYLMRDHG